MQRLSTRLVIQLAAVGLLGCGVERPPPDRGVGDQCRPRWVYPGGFQLGRDLYLEPTAQCIADGCLVNHYHGDLIDSPVEGDGIPEFSEQCGERCGWAGIEDRIYCTCKCGVSAGGDPGSVTCRSCPRGFECCPIERGVGDFCVREGTCAPLPEDPGGPSNDVDLLVMVDSSDSMREEQVELTTMMPSVITALTDPPDDDRDGVPDFPAVSSLHIGVISADMGTAGYPGPGCENSERGDDGVLQNTPSPSVAGCDASYPMFLTWDADAPDPDLGHDFECIATLGTNGCVFELPLHAVEKALTVHSAPGAANCPDPIGGDCFLRDDALLAILIVTDDDDCSVMDPTIFSDDDELGPMNLRCFNNPRLIRPVDEFVSTILTLKPGRPDRIVVAGIVGVPFDLVELTEEDLDAEDIMTTQDFEDILDDPRMIEGVDYSPEGGGNRLVPSCDVPGLGMAFPPRRIVQLIMRIDEEGNGGIVQSICRAGWDPLPITRLVQSHIGGGECGNGVLEGHELCDGSEFAAELGSCEALGFDGGALGCHVDCTPSFFGCRLGGT